MDIIVGKKYKMKTWEEMVREKNFYTENNANWRANFEFLKRNAGRVVKIVKKSGDNYPLVDNIIALTSDGPICGSFNVPIDILKPMNIIKLPDNLFEMD